MSMPQVTVTTTMKPIVRIEMKPIVRIEGHVASPEQLRKIAPFQRETVGALEKFKQLVSTARLARCSEGVEARRLLRIYFLQYGNYSPSFFFIPEYLEVAEYLEDLIADELKLLGA